MSSSFCFPILFLGCLFLLVVLVLVSSVLSQEIGWEERLRSDLFCVESDVKYLPNEQGILEGALKIFGSKSVGTIML